MTSLRAAAMVEIGIVRWVQKAEEECWWDKGRCWICVWCAGRIETEEEAMWSPVMVYHRANLVKV